MSIEDTKSTIHSPNQNNDDAASRELLRKITQHVKDLSDLLRAQQEMLRKRGMNLPSGSLERLHALRTRLDALNKNMLNTQSELRTLRALADTTALINSSLDTDEVLNQVIDTVIQLMNAERGYIVLKNRATGEFDDFRVARGLDREQLVETGGENAGNQKRELIVSRSIVNDVARTGEPILTSNAQDDERYENQQSIVSYALRSIVAVPLKVRGELIGVVYCDNRIFKNIFKQHELELLRAFADQAAVAIDNARLFEEANMQLAQVTEMRDLMENIFVSIASGVITISSDGRVITFNQPAREILQIDNTAIGKPMQEVFPDMDMGFFNEIERVRETKTTLLIEAKPIMPDSSMRYWNVTASILRAVRGQGEGLAIVIDDLTEQKEHEAQMVEVMRYLPSALVKNIRSVDDIDTAGQEREITAIFADVRGFTSFSENLEPDVLMQIINRYLSVASDAINLYEGIVDKYMGDAVTGLFNTQLNPQHDHAGRAVSASLAILYDLYALHEVLPEEQRLFFGIGIHTGMAVLGNVGSPERKEFAALGEATELCKVLQESAHSNIVVSPQTYEYIKDQYECEMIPLKKTKGDLTHGYVVKKRIKGTATSSMFLGEDFADLLNDLKD